MKAEEAKKLSEASVKTGPQATAWLNVIYKKIEDAAKDGDRKINESFTGYRMPGPSFEQRKRIIETLRADGYKAEIKLDRNEEWLQIEW